LYMPPELHKEPRETITYKGEAHDLFALGVVLFTMYKLVYPFGNENAEESNKIYKFIIEGRLDKFWNMHRNAGGPEFSAELKDLIEKMLCYEPEQRLTIDQIRHHPWMQGEHASNEEIANEIALRIEKIKKNNSASGEGRKNEKFKAFPVHRGQEEV
jgi:serine/threonine protein kinase